ncbi:hypothetical protein PLICRDRAFT_241008 [Plicaturopsis crispa FD-325 SS-3]|nr:hypothetical protein PLICRDRAFT_241008 [Plicaturopsis crispa FD-325 SS-3]
MAPIPTSHKGPIPLAIIAIAAVVLFFLLIVGYKLAIFLRRTIGASLKSRQSAKLPFTLPAMTSTGPSSGLVGYGSDPRHGVACPAAIYNSALLASHRKSMADTFGFVEKQLDGTVRPYPKSGQDASETPGLFSTITGSAVAPAPSIQEDRSPAVGEISLSDGRKIHRISKAARAALLATGLISEASMPEHIDSEYEQTTIPAISPASRYVNAPKISSSLRYEASMTSDNWSYVPRRKARTPSWGYDEELPVQIIQRKEVELVRMRLATAKRGLPPVQNVPEPRPVMSKQNSSAEINHGLFTITEELRPIEETEATVSSERSPELNDIKLFPVTFDTPQRMEVAEPRSHPSRARSASISAPAVADRHDSSPPPVLDHVKLFPITLNSMTAMDVAPPRSSVLNQHSSTTRREAKSPNLDRAKLFPVAIDAVTPMDVVAPRSEALSPQPRLRSSISRMPVFKSRSPTEKKAKNSLYTTPRRPSDPALFTKNNNAVKPQSGRAPLRENFAPSPDVKPVGKSLLQSKVPKAVDINVVPPRKSRPKSPSSIDFPLPPASHRSVRKFTGANKENASPKATAKRPVHR